MQNVRFSHDTTRLDNGCLGISIAQALRPEAWFTGRYVSWPHTNLIMKECLLCFRPMLDSNKPVQRLTRYFLAHLSRRLTGELIGYPWIGCPSSSSSVHRPFTFSNIFSSETAWPIKAKFYVEPPLEGGTKVCINGPGHMTKMAAMPIYGKNPSKIFFSRTGRPISTKLGM